MFSHRDRFRIIKSVSGRRANIFASSYCFLLNCMVGGYFLFSLSVFSGCWLLNILFSVSLLVNMLRQLRKGHKFH